MLTKFCFIILLFPISCVLANTQNKANSELGSYKKQKNFKLQKDVKTSTIEVPEIKIEKHESRAWKAFAIGVQDFRLKGGIQSEFVKQWQIENSNIKALAVMSMYYTPIQYGKHSLLLNLSVAYAYSFVNIVNYENTLVEKAQLNYFAADGGVGYKFEFYPKTYMGALFKISKARLNFASNSSITRFSKEIDDQFNTVFISRNLWDNKEMKISWNLRNPKSSNDDSLRHEGTEARLEFIGSF